MARLRTRIERAAALHRQAAAVAAVAAGALDAPAPTGALAELQAEQRQLAARLRAAAGVLAPGWLGADLDALALSTPLGGHAAPTHVRIGHAHPLDDARFPIVVPLLGAGHLAVDADARDPRVAGLLRSLILRLIAGAPPGTLRVRTVDTLGEGSTFAPFHAGTPDRDAGASPFGDLMPPPVTDRAGLREALDEAERWVRQPPGDGRILLLVIASLPELTEGSDLHRVSTLARTGPGARLHLVVAGWPPPPLTAETTQPPLPRCTQITLRNPYAWVGNPPDGSYAAVGRLGPGMPGRLNAPAYLDPDPPTELVRRVCDQLSEQVHAARVAERDGPGFGALLRAPLWQESSEDGLAVTVGADEVELRLDDTTAHCLVDGGPDAFALEVLYGLSVRYGPDELALYLLDFAEGASLAAFVPSPGEGTWLPQVVAAGVEPDREYGLAVLRELVAEADRRAAGGRRTPRTVCLVNEFPALLAGDDATAREAATLLESLSTAEHRSGVHLILSSRAPGRLEAVYGRHSAVPGRFPLRVTSPGPGGAGAVVTTGGGTPARVLLTADPATVTALRHRLWESRPAGAQPPPVLTGRASARLSDDATYVQLAARTADRDATPLPVDRAPRVLLGHAIDVPGSTLSFPLDAAPGRHVAILGADGAGILAAAVLSLAAQHRPGTARFLLARPAATAAGAGGADGSATARPADRAGGADGSATAAAEALGAELAAAGHDVRAFTPDADGFAGHTYVVSFGGGATGLRGVLRDGPRHHTHLLGWWPGPRDLAGDLADDVTDGLGGGRASEGIACLVATDVPAADLSRLLGAAVEWRHRPHRALLHDRVAGRTATFVPFIHNGRPG